VKLLLDTHFLLWMMQDRGRLSVAELALLGRDDVVLLMSPIVIWEIRLKWNIPDRHGRPKGLISPEAAMGYVVQNGIEMAPLTGEHCAAALDPPIPHKDPFDEMLLVHAGQLGARLLTRDRLLVGHPLAITP
jgi:PIN domain nuclease of toxin-antitoxin system